MNGTKRMKRLLPLLLSLLLFLCACGQAPEEQPEPEADYPYDTFTYTHYASGGTAEEYTAVILFEQSCSTFTSYQVAFSSCTCRDSMVNYFSVCYVELLNTRPTGDQSAIRSITFGENRGLWGDSNPNYYISDYTQEYMDENFVQQLVGVTKQEFDGWGGYGTQLEAVEPDTVSGATVSTGNITAMLKELFAYHAAKYYPEKPTE